MKKLLLRNTFILGLTIVTLFLLPHPAKAGLISAGPRIGVGINRLSVRHVTPSITNIKTQPAFHIGAFSKISLLGIFVQPELLLTGYYSKFQQTGRMGNQTPQDVKLGVLKLDMPISIGIKFLLAKAFIGPKFTFLVHMKESEKNNSKFKQAKDAFNRISAGLHIGVGLEVWKLVLDLKYDHDFATLGKKIGSENVKYGSQQLIVSVGYCVI